MVVIGLLRESLQKEEGRGRVGALTLRTGKGISTFAPLEVLETCYLLPVSNGTNAPVAVPKYSISSFSSLAKKY